MQHHKYRTVLQCTAMLLVTVVLIPLGLRAQDAGQKATAQRDSTIHAESLKGIPVSGRITEAGTGTPVPGINVMVRGYSAAITNDKGSFEIRVPSLNATLTLSAEGFQTKEIALKGRRRVGIRMYQEPFNSFYDEARLPFGPLSKAQTPYAVQSLDMHDKWQRTTGETADNYLQGEVSGLNAIRRSGTPGIGSYLSLRGFTSLFATNQPLIIVDGMIYDNGQYGSSLISGHVENPLSDIDIKDIDNITVIKDGTSTYGTRGANGVILITTARAKELATRIDFATYGGFNSAPTALPVMDARDYRIYLSDLLQSGGFSNDSIQRQPYMMDAPNPDYYTYHNNTAWQKQVLQNSYNQNYYLKVTGGDNIATYALSLGYLKNAGVLDNTDLTRSQTRFNADLNLSPKLKASVNLSFTSNQQNLMNEGLASGTNPLYLAQAKAPILAVHAISEDGIVSPNLSDYDVFNMSNPVALVDHMQAQDKNYRFTGSAKFDYLINESLTLETLIGVTFDKVKENIFIPDEGVISDTLTKAVTTNKSGSNIERLYSLYNDTHLSYDHTFNDIHHLTANIGFRYSNDKSEDEQGVDFNSATDEFVSVGMGAASLRSLGGNIGQWNWFNNYLNVNYGLLDKYFLSANLAVDGSSRFGKMAPDGLKFSGNKFAVMPSIAAAWLISSEHFMAGAGFVDLLKLRASYGRVGNDDIGNYAARQYYTSQNLLGMEGLVRGSFGNSSLEWESVDKLDIGLDASFFNERLNVSLDGFSNKTTQMITPDSLGTATGFPFVSINNSRMKTTGFDASVNGRILNRKFKWDLGISLTRYHNTVTAIPSGRMLTSFAGATYITETGHAANLFFGYKTDGIFATDAAAQSSGLMNERNDGSMAPFKGGDVRFRDLNGDHVINDQDRQIIGDPNPSVAGGLTNTFSWKSWSLSALFSFSAGNDIYDYNRAQLESMDGPENQSLAVVNRWKADGQQTGLPRAAWGDPSGNARFSDRWIEDGSYLRLRTLSVSYNLPLKASALKYIKIYATGNNLFTWTHYLGYDPEFNASNSLFGQGIDLGLEPEFRTVQLGIRLGF